VDESRKEDGVNHGTITGGIVEDARSAWTPATAEAPSIRRVVFKIATRDSHKADGFWNCEAEGDEALLDFLEREAQAGRGIKVDYELATRPFYKRVGREEVRAGDSRFLRVRAAEINGVRVPGELALTEANRPGAEAPKDKS
jgi:hypothetical protein